jgi:hypothetical protein
VGNGSGLSRGDRNRNARLARLRELVPARNAIVGIDLADAGQAAVVTDHDSRVLARRRVSARAWELGELLDWAVARASAAGFSSVTVACEPTGHRWRVLDQLAGATIGELRDDPDLRAVVQQAVDRANAAVSRPETIKRFRVLPGPFQVGAELTPTGKVRRDYVLAKYASDIDALYA